MPFKSDTYRVLIASPSDLEEERRAATDAINEWNAQHAAAEAAVLLPVKWETHATPETGVSPQGSINRQLVGNSDLLVGMFWTKFGDLYTIVTQRENLLPSVERAGEEQIDGGA